MEQKPRKREPRKRLLYLDSVRGFCTMIIIVAHAFSHLMFWDMNLIPLEEVSIIAIIILAPFIIIATSAPVFVLLSATALSYNFYSDVRDYIKSISENNNNQKSNIDISFKDPALSRIVKKNLISYLVFINGDFGNRRFYKYRL